MEARQLPKLTKNQKNILVAAEKKRFCDQRALHIVELLIEPVLDSAWLLHQLQFIEQQHYEDVTEERACTGCCGYPLCQSRLGRVPRHQYRISTNTNRIYDWSERKKFCSNACFRASRHLKPQIPTTPLWLRDTEPPPVFRLLHGEHNRRGVAGDVVELAVARAPADDPAAEHVTATEVATDMMHQFDELSERIRDLPLKPEEQQSDTTANGQSAPLNKQRRSCLRRPAASTGGDGAAREADRTETGRECQTPAGDVASDGHRRVEPRRVEFSETRGRESQDGVPPGDTDVSQKAETDVESSSSPVNTARRPGTDVSAESPCTTEPAVGQSPASREEASPSARTSGFKRPERAPQRRQQHPLQVVEARLLDWLSAVPLRVEIPTDNAVPADTAPAPDTASAPAITPQEAAARNQALLAYLQGSVRLPPAAPPAARPAAAAEEQLTEGGRPVPPEPLLESQDRQRRRIVNDHLGKATGRLLAPLGLLMSDVAGPLRQLVASFHLTATNVTMSPSQWSLASLVLLRCLLRVDGQLAGLARGTDAAFSSALRPLQLTPASLERLTVRLVALLQARHPRGPATPSPGAASDAAAGSS